MNYKNKYFKYKMKYLNLKVQSGGVHYGSKFEKIKNKTERIDALYNNFIHFNILW